MAEFKLGRLKFVWQGAWVTGTAYVKDDVVRYGGKTYVCVTGHTANANFYTDLGTSYWSLMGDGIAWVGTWTGSTFYKVGDIVKNGGQSYICTTGHTSVSTFASDSSNWTLISGGFAWRGSWQQSTLYNVNDVVMFGAVTYICTTANTSSSDFATDQSSKWQVFVQGTQFINTWNNSTEYSAGSIVTYGGYSYVSTQTNTGQVPSSSPSYWNVYTTGYSNQGTFSYGTTYKVGSVVQYGGNTYVAILDNTNQYPSNATYWSIVAYGIKVNGPYVGGTTYNLNDVVTYGGSAYRALQTNTSIAPSALSPNWQVLSVGLVNQGVWSGSTNYKLNDLVQYGANIYIAIQDNVAQTPSTAASYWSVFNYGYNYQGTWSSATNYTIGQVVTYGGSLFQAKSDNNNVNPTTTATWNKLSYGVKNRGTWTTSTAYNIDELVTHGANTYISLIPHTSGTFSSDLSTAKWQLMSSGLQYRGVWAGSTSYYVNDIVQGPTGSVYVALLDHTSGGDFPTDLAASKWTLFIAYSSTTLPSLPSPAVGKSLTVSSNGSTLSWLNTTGSANVLYVGPGGSDASNQGTSLATPFATIKYACSVATSGNVIYVKSGTYSEQLPITVPAGVSIVGDSYRTVTVQPTSGLSDDAVTPNNQATMWKLSDGTNLSEMTFANMTGWVPGSTTSDISTSTPKGVYVAFNSASVITRPPSVSNCTTSSSSGAIGAYLDGSLHGSGQKTMAFRYYNITSDTGVGFWATNNAKLDLTTCTSSYCYFGFATSAGGTIRSDNGTAKWGTYGGTSVGYSSLETAATGNIVGQQLNFSYNTGTIAVGDTVTSITSGGTATVIGVQTAYNKVFVSSVTGSFLTGDALSFTSGGSGIVTTGVTNQTGAVLALNTLAALPTAGGVVTIGSDSYIIQSVSGAYVNSASVITVFLTSAATNLYANAAAVTIRYQTSQTRLSGHDFYNVGTGGVTNTNYPGTPLSGPFSAQEIQQILPGRVYYSASSQDGRFAVGNYLTINQSTGTATLNPAAFTVTGNSALTLGAIGTLTGATINKFSTDGTLINNSNTSVPTENAVKTYVDNARTQALEPTGFNLNNLNSIGIIEISNDGVNIVKIDQNGAVTTRADSTFGTGTVYSRAASARTIAIYPVSGQTSVSVWISGIQYTYTKMQTTTYSSLSNLNYAFFNASGIVVYTSGTVTDTIFQTFAQLLTFTGTDSTNTFAITSAKRCGINMPGQVQNYLSNSVGAAYKTGLGVTGVVASATAYTNTVAGTTQVQDLTHTFASLSTNYWLYNVGGVWTVSGSADNNFSYLSTGTAQYNGSGALTTLSSGQYTVTYFIATSDKVRGGVMKLVGQRVFTTLAAARQSAQSEPRDTSLVGLPFQDFVWIGAVVVNSTGAVQTLDNGLTYIDLRYQIISAGTNALGNYLVNASAADLYYNNSAFPSAGTNVQSAIDTAAASLSRARTILSLNTLWTNAW